MADKLERSVLKRIWSAPLNLTKSMTAELAVGHKEERAFFYLILGSFFTFLSRLPSLLIANQSLPKNEAMARLAGSFFASMMLAPLFLYGIAAILQFMYQILGGKGQGVDTRLAFFWAILVTSPFYLILGAISPKLSPEISSILSLLVFGWFFVICSQFMLVTQKPRNIYISGAILLASFVMLFIIILILKMVFL